MLILLFTVLHIPQGAKRLNTLESQSYGKKTWSDVSFCDKNFTTSVSLIHQKTLKYSEPNTWVGARFVVILKVYMRPLYGPETNKNGILYFSKRFPIHVNNSVRVSHSCEQLLSLQRLNSVGRRITHHY